MVHPLRFLLLLSLMSILHIIIFKILTLVPISLRVTSDIAKLLYSYYIQWDIDLYDSDSVFKFINY